MLPFIIEVEDVAELNSWASTSRLEFRRLLSEHGAILFRGFNSLSLWSFESFVGASTSDEWVEYREAATPRSHVSGNVFTSTEFPPKQTIFFHNENSHTTSWPLYLAFFCEIPPQSGGQTPISDCRQLYQQVPKDLRESFERLGVRYERSFGYGLGIPWKDAFSVSSHKEMEAYCDRHGMELVWQGDERCKIRYTRSAARQHPITNDHVWFNHATFFNFFSLERQTQELIEEFVGRENAPYNTYFGNGDEISRDVVELLKSLYESNSSTFDYQSGDVLLIDNMLTAHGRRPFEGQRKVFVAMTRKVLLEGC